MEKRAKVLNVIFALFASKLLLILLIQFIIDARVSSEDIRIVLQAHCEGSSLRGISRTTKLAYNTVVKIVRDAAVKAQMVHQC